MQKDEEGQPTMEVHGKVESRESHRSRLLSKQITMKYLNCKNLNESSKSKFSIKYKAGNSKPVSHIHA